MIKLREAHIAVMMHEEDGIYYGKLTVNQYYFPEMDAPGQTPEKALAGALRNLALYMIDWHC